MKNTPSNLHERLQQWATSIDKKYFYTFCCLTILLLGLYLRMSGLFRGLNEPNYSFHPDEAKQVLALYNFLHGTYIRYYGNFFYDGYPYGLNHLDEYLIRPLLFFLGTDNPNRTLLYPYARLLRVAYGISLLLIGYKLVYGLVKERATALLAMLFLALAPITITVTHFATGDVGVDFFTAICLLFMLFYLQGKQNATWLFASGFAVGAAFSAKYNGALAGMIPALVLVFQLPGHWNFRRFTFRCLILFTGAIGGVATFTPHLFIDFGTTVSNIFASFAFIKDYNVPPEVLKMSWGKRALLGLHNNTIYIIASLGYTMCFVFILAALLTFKKHIACIFSSTESDNSRINLLSATALFSILTFFISLAGKYSVQPFHFSSLQLPVAVVACSLFPVLFSSRSILLRASGTLLALAIIFEFGHTSVQENYFWRREDTLLYQKYLPSSLYSPVALLSRNQGTLRSLYLEPSGTAFFKNLKYNQVKGPDATLWNTLQVAPLPQVPNPIGKNWIFLNGPTFPRNERMFFVHGGGKGTTVTRQLVLPAGQEPPELGIRCGSYGTTVDIDFGGAMAQLEMEAHQQQTVSLQPKRWKISGDLQRDAKQVQIINLSVSIPHDDVWVTILGGVQEKKVFTLFGGGQGGAPLTAPKKIPSVLENKYPKALKRLKYMEAVFSRRIQAGEEIPMWAVTLPAGHYKLNCEIKGNTDSGSVAIELEDARGGLYRQQKQVFQLKKGIQSIEYNFTKPFAPYQGRILMTGIQGDGTVLSFTLVPDYTKIADDFERWRLEGKKPDWVSRFGESPP